MKHRHLLLTGLTAVVLSGCMHTPADLKTGRQAYLDQDYTTAFDHYKQLADFGIPQAKTELGKLYLSGHGTNEDPATALALFEEAERAGDVTVAPRYIASAQTKLGTMALKSEPGAPSPEQGITLLQQAAARNEPAAWFELGSAYEKGVAVEQSGAVADQSYAKAAALGYARADYNRAQLYRKGKLVRQNMPLAIQLYEQAGTNDYPRAWQELGKIYEKGEGVPTDLNKAADYYMLAQAGGMDVTADQMRLKEKKEESSERPYLTLGSLLSEL